MRFLAFLLATCFFTNASAQQASSTSYEPPDPSTGYGNDLSAKTQWSNLLGNLLWFYEAQRSGQLGPNNRVSWRNSSALKDGADDGVDLTGGYYDAGDYIKATYPLAYTLFSVCWGANVFGAGYDNAQQTQYLDEMLRWGLDWLMKAHPQPNELYVQVGDTNVDNDYWGGDQNIPSPRTLYKVGGSTSGTDVAARAAAAFASCSVLYSNFSISPSTSSPASLANSSYATTLYQHASQLYTFSQQKPFQTYSSAISGVGWAYPSSGYAGDQAVAAVMMGLATQATSQNSSSSSSPQTYLDSATSLYSSSNLQASKQDVVLNWDSISPVLPVILAQISQLNNPHLQPAGGISQWQSETEAYFDRIIKGNGRGYLTKGGLLWYDGDSDMASLNPAMNAAQLMALYAPFASSSDKKSSYQEFASKQWQYALGNNPMSVPYIVGSNPNSPTNPHDAKSSGGSDIGAIDTDPVDSLHILFGAVVGGPTNRDQFYNIRSDWPEMEVALDYNAPFLTLAAYSVLNSTDQPFFTSLGPGAYESVKPSGTPCDAVFSCRAGRHLSEGGKIAMAVAITVVGLIIIGLILCISCYGRGSGWLSVFSLRKSSVQY